MGRKRSVPSSSPTSWDPVADWYAGWVGRDGSEHHQQLAIPFVLDLLKPQAGEHILDIGCGPGVLAAPLAAQGAHYVGIDASSRLIQIAKKRHKTHGNFLLGDAAQLANLPELSAAMFDGVVFMLSIQDMNPLDQVLRSAAWVLRTGGRIVLLLTHPCFRVPRQSGWGWDEGRKLRYRRVDRYLTPLAVPMKTYHYGALKGSTRSFHRPLEQYVNGLAAQGLLVEQLREIPTHRSAHERADRISDAEIPLFLAIRAVRKGESP